MYNTICEENMTQLYMIHMYILYVYNLGEMSNSIEDNNTYTNTKKLYRKQICTDYVIYAKNMITISIIVLIAGHKWSHPHGDHESKMTKSRIHNDRNITESKKYGCVCTCCHRNDLPQYNCVIFVKCNYNLNIPAVANALSTQYWEISHKEFICKSCHKELKDGKYSKSVQNCVNSDMFGSNVNYDQNNQHNVQEKRIHNENTIISDFPANYTSQSTTLTN